MPQGNTLGSSLFNVNLNDIVNINLNAKFVIYADVTSLFFASTNCEDLIDIVNATLKQMGEWTEINCLRINTNKTKARTFHAQNKNICKMKYMFLHSQKIETVKSFKTLGVSF